MLHGNAVSKKIVKELLKSDYAVLIVLLLFIIIATFIVPSFFSLRNMINLLVRTSATGIAAIGMTFVILTGGIDLSIGGIVVLTAYIGAETLISDLGVNIWLTAIAMPVVGALMGAFNGFNIVSLGMPPFIATLIGMNLARGLAQFLYKGKTVFGLPEVYALFGCGTVGGVPIPILILIFVFILAFLVLQFNAFGRRVYAVGSNAKAAWLSGVNTQNVIFSAYVISGFLAGLTALIMSSRLTSVVGGLGLNLELDTIAAVVIGGTSLFGGEGGIFGSVIGALIIEMIGNVLTLGGVSPFFQMVAKGIVLWAAVALDMTRKGYTFRKFGSF